MNTTSTPTTNININEKGKHKFKDTAKVFEHLEYLGYTVDNISDDINDVLIADGINKPGITITINQDWMQFIAFYAPYDADSLKDIEFLATINDINKIVVQTMWFATKVNDKEFVRIGIYATYRCYDKISFGNFVSTFEQEIRFNFAKHTKLKTIQQGEK